MKLEDWSFRIGKFHVMHFSDDSIWIAIDGGEGMEIKEDKFEAMLKELYEKKF